MLTESEPDQAQASKAASPSGLNRRHGAERVALYIALASLLATVVIGTVSIHHSDAGAVGIIQELRLISGPLAEGGPVGYSPERRTWAWKPDVSVRETTFNSMTDVPSVGDERGFCNAKPASNRNSEGWSHTVEVTAGSQWLVRAYVANDADLDVPAATGVHLALTWSQTGNRVVLTCALTAGNATPPTVADTVEFVSATGPVSLGLEPGSARLYNMAHTAGLPIPDLLASPEGTQLGFKYVDGTLQGGFDHVGLVTAIVNVVAPE